MAAEQATRLIERQAVLQAEADATLQELEIEQALRAIGHPVRVGSSALGLMTRRDIDVTVICETLDARVRHAVGGLAKLLLGDERVRSLRFKNDCGAWNTSVEYPDGLYLGIQCRASSGNAWTLDIWFVDEPERQPDLTQLRTLLPRLALRQRETILAIKTALATGSTERVSSHLVYEAVLDGGVTDSSSFETWSKARLISCSLSGSNGRNGGVRG